MSIKISTLVWQHYPAGGGELLTALAFADHAHDDGTSIRPSVRHVAKKTRQSARTVQRHLSSMRRSGWLLTVRYPQGGRGYATEYRINPQWISNPANLSHFTNTVTAGTVMGDTASIKRVPSMTPQPSGIIIETKRPNSDMTWPQIRLTRKSIQIIEQCPIEVRKSVLDEITALHNLGRVKNPSGLLKKLVTVAIAGNFKPSMSKQNIEHFNVYENHGEQPIRPQQSSNSLDCKHALGQNHLRTIYKTLQSSALHKDDSTLVK